MRVAQPIVLSEDARRKLEQQSRGRSTQARVVLRSRIVLLAAEGLQNKHIAAALNVASRMAALWLTTHSVDGPSLGSDGTGFTVARQQSRPRDEQNIEDALLASVGA